jgi:uncharacterized protein YraI
VGADYTAGGSTPISGAIGQGTGIVATQPAIGQVVGVVPTLAPIGQTVGQVAGALATPTQIPIGQVVGALATPTQITFAGSVGAVTGNQQGPQVGQYAIVTGAVNPLQMFTGPGTGFQLIARLEPGEVVMVLEGPMAATTGDWWRIQRDDGTTGWVSQGTGPNSTLRAANATSGGGSTGNTGSGNTGSGGGTASTTAGHLNPGDQAIVTVDGDGLRIRSGPGTQYTATGDLRTGTLLCIVDGPQTANGYQWYALGNIGSNQLVGWVAEGGNGEIWLEEHIDSNSPNETSCP